MNDRDLFTVNLDGLMGRPPWWHYTLVIFLVLAAVVVLSLIH